MTKYMKERGSNLLIRDRGDDYMLERFNYKSKRWVEDVTMCQIYTVSIVVEPVTEKQVKEIIGG